MKPQKRIVVRLILFFLILVLFLQPLSWAQPGSSGGFQCIVLGSGGGIRENNLSAYLLAPEKSNDFICLDAGTVYSGIEQAVKLGNFYQVFVPEDSGASKPGYIFRELMRGYLISHAHLDHVAGLVIASPAATPTNIYGSSATIEALRENLFNWEVWPNFANEGPGMTLDVFNYKSLEFDVEYRIDGTKYRVTAFPVSHQEPFESTAFLIEYLGRHVLYVGDTGSDTLERTNNLSHIWKTVAPIINRGNLNAVFLECSWPEERPDTQLFGHLKPSLVMHELKKLAAFTDSENIGDALRGLPVIVTGIKPSWKEGGDNKYLIYKQLLQRNDLGVKFIIPEQGQLIEF